MKYFTTRQLVYISILICLDIVLTRVASLRISIGGVEGIRLGFGALPIILGGVLMGPLAGGIIGALGDLLGYFINPIGVYMPHFTLTAALTGIIPALILGKRRNQGFSTWHLMLAITVGQVLTSILLVPYFLQMLFKLPLAVTLPSRIISQSILIPLYTILTTIIVRNMDRGLIKEKLPANQ